ncbi:DUF2975 domain-containing protein [Companilactobacillus baiquanensis]|nr:DUF2975 domain-containing protein [Companilactobacillus baiquanensis]
MKKLTIFLRFSLCIMLFFLTLICIFFFPNVLLFMALFKANTILTIIFGIGLYASAIGSYTIIFFTWRILRSIDTNQIFTNSNIFSLNMIKLLGYSIAAIYMLMIPSILALSDDGRSSTLGMFFVNIFLIGLGITIGVFAQLLKRICSKITKFQIENELTI